VIKGNEVGMRTGADPSPVATMTGSVLARRIRGKGLRNSFRIIGAALLQRNQGIGRDKIADREKKGEREESRKKRSIGDGPQRSGSGVFPQKIEDRMYREKEIGCNHQVHYREVDRNVKTNITTRRVHQKLGKTVSRQRTSLTEKEYEKREEAREEYKEEGINYIYRRYALGEISEGKNQMGRKPVVGRVKEPVSQPPHQNNDPEKGRGEISK